jgi:hypothetical protein
MNGYELSRYWFDWCFENPEKISPNHTALYFFCIEHCNRMGWKEKFGLPTSMAKEAIGIRSYNTYINTLNDLVSFGFIILIEKSKNQYSSNIIALSKNNKALNKALDKAGVNHTTKQVKSTQQSIDSINKQDNIEQINKVTNSPYGDGHLHFLCLEFSKENKDKYPIEFYKNFLEYWTASVQKKGKDFGKELWKTEKTFALPLRLNTSYKLTWVNNPINTQAKQVLKTRPVEKVLELTEEEKYRMRIENGLLNEEI